MKTTAKIVLALVFSHSGHAGDLDELIGKVCLSPAQAGKYWNIKVDGKADANGTIRLFSAGINGEASFTKGEWEGVQQVLKSHQAGDNDSFRKCAMALTPLFLPKFAPVASAPKTKPESAKAVYQEINGTKNVNVNSTGNGDVNVIIK